MTVKKENKTKNRAGFTLIEMMVVVAIIGILSLMGMRVYAGFQYKAKDALLKGNVSTIHTYIQAELSDDKTSGAEVWENIDALFSASGIYFPAANSPQLSNIGEISTEPPSSFEGLGGKVFVFVDNANQPTKFYINGVNAEETNFVFPEYLIAQK